MDGRSLVVFFKPLTRGNERITQSAKHLLWPASSRRPTRGQQAILLRFFKQPGTMDFIQFSQEVSKLEHNGYLLLG
jgi:hypothetical protein